MRTFLWEKDSQSLIKSDTSNCGSVTTTKQYVNNTCSTNVFSICCILSQSVSLSHHAAGKNRSPVQCEWMDWCCQDVTMHRPCDHHSFRVRCCYRFGRDVATCTSGLSCWKGFSLPPLLAPCAALPATNHHRRHHHTSHSHACLFKSLLANDITSWTFIPLRLGVLHFPSTSKFRGKSKNAKRTIGTALFHHLLLLNSNNWSLKQLAA